MKRLWSRFLTAAALGCLLAVWAFPVSAYYPPLEAKASKSGRYHREFPSRSLIFEVIDPQDKKQWFGNMYLGVIDHVERDGVLAMIQGIPGDVKTYRVTCVTYDPYQKDFVEDTQGPYSGIDQLQVADGVVAYIATDLEGKKAFAYATYDPIEVMWRKMKWAAIPMDGLPNAPLTDLWVTTADGVVAYGFKYDNIFGHPASDLYADIYNPLEGNWQTGLDGIFTLLGTFLDEMANIKNFRIENATIAFSVWNFLTRKWDGRKYGYSVSNGIWSPGTATAPLAYFAAQPSQHNPLWVWFTDMSIGAAKWHWDFGDGNQDNKRSTWHKYVGGGQYVVQQEIEGNGTAEHSETINLGP